jgi:hypothetical protein
VKRRLKARIVEQEETAIVMKWFGNNTPAAMDMQAKIEVMRSDAFLCGLCQGYIARTIWKINQS